MFEYSDDLDSLNPLCFSDSDGEISKKVFKQKKHLANLLLGMKTKSNISKKLITALYNTNDFENQVF